MEAMACGLPVVATNVGGVADLVTNGVTGFLYDSSSTDGALSPLERLSLEPELRVEMGHRARAFIEQQHSLARWPEMLSDFYGTIRAAI
jgi:glycosyltransferase involved in cell wall biosynthesis